MDLRVDFIFRGLALCFLHKAILQDEHCQFPPLDDAQLAVTSARIEAALGRPEEPFPKYLFQIVNADLGRGLIWPRDTRERDDAPCLLEVFRRVPPTEQGCRVVHVVEDNWLKVGLCRSEVIQYSECPGLTTGHSVLLTTSTRCRQHLLCAPFQTPRYSRDDSHNRGLVVSGTLHNLLVACQSCSIENVEHQICV